MSAIDRNDNLGLLDPNFKVLVDGIMYLVKLHNLPMKVYETFRTEERQLRLMNKGVSRTMHSLHCKGKAVDIVVCIDGKWNWSNEVKFYYDFLGALVEAEYPDKIKWGGRFLVGDGKGGFVHFYDGAHFEVKMVRV